VKIGGGYLRFQAQYLRRIRVPGWDGVSGEQRRQLADAGVAGVKVEPGLLERIYSMEAGSLDFMKDWQ